MSEPVVFDCMVFLQAAARPSRVHGLFEAVHRGELTLYISPAILAEVRDVLTRPSLQRKFPALTVEVVEGFLADILAHATLIQNVPSVYTFTRDPKDEKYLNLAIHIRADVLASADNDLLDLMTSASPDAQSFRAQYPTLRILKPGTLLRDIELRRNPPTP